MKEPNLKEMCGGFAVKAVQSIIILPLMPLMFMVGVISAGTIACLSVGTALGAAARKIKGKR